MNNTFAKLILSFLTVFTCVNLAPSQGLCEFSSNGAPLLLNLRPGMSSEQVQSALGKSPKVKVKKDGERIFFQSYAEKSAPTALKNVNAFYLRFFDRQLYQIEVFYNTEPDLSSLELITQSLSNQLNFPLENWQIKNNRAAANCDEHSLKADNILNSHIELTDETVRRKVEAIRKRDQSKK